MRIQNNCYINNPKTDINKQSPHFVYNQNAGDISFCATLPKLMKLAKYYVYLNITAFGVFTMAIVSAGGVNTNQNQVEKRSGWDSNIKVFAATGQNRPGFNTGSASYSLKLCEELLKPDIKTLEEANHSLMKNGYKLNHPFGLQSLLSPAIFIIESYLNNKDLTPLETYGVNLGIFNKEDKNKERFILNFYDKSEKRFLSSTDKFSKKMKQIYGLPSENIIKIPVDSLKNIEQGLDSFLSKINKLKSKGNVELLIVYNAHGLAESLKKGAEKVEGGMEGIMGTTQKIEETQVKKLFHKKLQGIKTLFLLDTCHAGAWISENAKKSLKIFA